MSLNKQAKTKMAEPIIRDKGILSETASPAALRKNGKKRHRGIRGNGLGSKSNKDYNSILSRDIFSSN